MFRFSSHKNKNCRPFFTLFVLTLVPLYSIPVAARGLICLQPGHLDGMFGGEIRIDRLALVTSALPTQAISTDEEETVEPYVPASISPLYFNDKKDTVTLTSIKKEHGLLLPAPAHPVLSLAIKTPTRVTSSAPVTGDYGDDGSITLPNVPVHLETTGLPKTDKNYFAADFVVTLQTGTVPVPDSLDDDLLQEVGFDLLSGGTAIQGSAVNKPCKTVLVGVSTFTNAEGTGLAAAAIGGSTAAVQIEGTITPPVKLGGID